MECKVGILAFQGDFYEHQEALSSLGVSSVFVKSLENLENLTHLILPGGESTVIAKFLESTGLGKEIQKRGKEQSLQIYGSCAGSILLANRVESKVPLSTLELIDVKVSRNAYGSQIHSFEADSELISTQEKFKAVFIRAPKILEIAQNVQVLAKYEGEIIAAEKDNIMISTFHPELICPVIFHKYFLQKRVQI